MLSTVSLSLILYCTRPAPSNHHQKQFLCSFSAFFFTHWQSVTCPQKYLGRSSNRRWRFGLDGLTSMDEQFAVTAKGREGATKRNGLEKKLSLETQSQPDLSVNWKEEYHTPNHLLHHHEDYECCTHFTDATYLPTWACKACKKRCTLWKNKGVPEPRRKYRTVQWPRGNERRRDKRISRHRQANRWTVGHCTWWVRRKRLRCRKHY